MTAHERLLLIGVMWNEHRRVTAVTEAGFGTTSIGDLTAVYLEEASCGARQGGRTAVARKILEHQKQQERLLAATGFLPAQPNLQFTSKADILSILEDSAEDLHELLERYGEREQYQVIVSWYPEAMLQRFLETGDGQRVASEAKAAGSRLAAGKIIGAAMEEWRAALSRSFSDTIEASTDGWQLLPVGEPVHLVNGVGLVPRGQSGALEAALETIDAAHPNGLKIKMIGPLPAVSFATIARRSNGDGGAAEALQVLGLSSSSTAGDAREAWIDLARRHHPDRGESDPTIMARFNTAYATAKGFLTRKPERKIQVLTDPALERKVS